MAIVCKGICVDFKSIGTKNKFKYERGQKRCTYCGLFLVTREIRCPCCRTILRTRSRTSRKIFGK